MNIPEKKLVLQGFMALGPIFRLVVGSKILPNFEFPQIYIYYISLKSIEHDFFFCQINFLCIQHAKISIKTKLSKIFEENVDGAKEDQFSTSSIKNHDVSKK